jgi:hypothetical protein
MSWNYETHATQVPVATPVAHLPLNDKAAGGKCHSQQSGQSYATLMVIPLTLVSRCDVRKVARDGRPLRLAGSVVRKESRSVPYSQEVVNVLCKDRVSLVKLLTFGWSVKSY